MMLVRSMMVRASSTLLSRAATIAIRFCALRRQFKNKDGSGEVQVLDYQGVQYRVLPWAAATFALHFTAKGMVAMHNEMASRVDADDDSLTAETHAIGSCLKVVCTTACVDGIEELRRACGGHGQQHLTPSRSLFPTPRPPPSLSPSLPPSRSRL